MGRGRHGGGYTRGGRHVRRSHGRSRCAEPRRLRSRCDGRSAGPLRGRCSRGRRCKARCRRSGGGSRRGVRGRGGNRSGGRHVRSRGGNGGSGRCVRSRRRNGRGRRRMLDRRSSSRGGRRVWSRRRNGRSGRRVRSRRCNGSGGRRMDRGRRGGSRRMRCCRRLGCVRRRRPSLRRCRLAGTLCRGRARLLRIDRLCELQGLRRRGVPAAGDRHCCQNGRRSQECRACHTNLVPRWIVRRLLIGRIARKGPAQTPAAMPTTRQNYGEPRGVAARGEKRRCSAASKSIHRRN
jgi:hypothetical protein